MYLQGIRVLDMSFCEQPTVIDAGLSHLAGIQKQCIGDCATRLTSLDAAFATLWGMRALNMSDPAALSHRLFAPPPGKSLAAH